MRISKVSLGFYRSVSNQTFEAGPFTVLFGKNDAGKTNLLEAIFNVFVRVDDPDDGPLARALRGQGNPNYSSHGAIYVDLEPGVAFDDAVLELVPHWQTPEYGVLRFRALPVNQVCFAVADGGPETWFTDVAEWFERADADWSIRDLDTEEGIWEVDEQSRSLDGPRPRPLFLGWEFDDINRWVTNEIADLTAYPNGGWAPIHRIGAQWLEPVAGDDRTGAWRVREVIRERLEQLSALASDLLPDFLDGTISAEFDIPTQWDATPRMRLLYQRRGGDDRDELAHHGRGTSRWMAIAVQLALHLMRDDADLMAVGVAGGKRFSGHVLLVDEPEAHLHSSAVASIVRWCQRMVKRGFNIMAASHHEEFLRVSGPDVRLVRVTHDTQTKTLDDGYSYTWSGTKARTIATNAVPDLQQLADDIGLHPAAALSLHRAILFVEGPLDLAVLDEYAGPELEAAGSRSSQFTEPATSRDLSTASLRPASASKPLC